MRCGQQPLEACGIDHLRVDHERVARVALLDEPVTERGPQSRHVGAHGVGGLFGRLLAGPDGVDQPVDRHDLAGVDDEGREQSPLPWTPTGTSVPLSRSSTGPKTWISMNATPTSGRSATS